MNNVVGTALVVALVLLAGCTGDGALDVGSVSGDSGSTGAGQNANEPSRDADNSASPNETLLPALGWLRVERCDHWHLAFTVPAAANGGSVPPSFNADDPPTLTRIGYLGFACDTVSIDRLDRGPVTMLFEFHTAFQVPEECRINVAGVSYWLTEQVIVDDPAIGHALAERGLSVVDSEISREVTQDSEIQVQDWAWMGPDGGASSLELSNDGTQDTSVRPPMRIFWGTPDGIGTGDLSFDLKNPMVTGRPASATMAEDMLIGEITPVGPNLASWHRDASMTAQLPDPEAACDP